VLARVKQLQRVFVNLKKQVRADSKNIKEQLPALKEEILAKAE